MSEFKGIQGPWVAGGFDIYSEDMDAHICIVSSFIDEETEEANINLIAAAPELLECCLRIQAQFRQAGIESKAGSFNPVEDNAAQIDAAIIKALGQ